MVATEINETIGKRFDELHINLQRKLQQKTCNNCKKELSDKNIDYVLTGDREVVWWHSANCKRVLTFKNK